jgi:hypothetical protein
VTCHHYNFNFTTSTLRFQLLRSIYSSSECCCSDAIDKHYALLCVIQLYTCIRSRAVVCVALPLQQSSIAHSDI